MLLALSSDIALSSTALAIGYATVLLRRRRAQWYRRLLADVASLLDVSTAELGPCLGTSGRTVGQWASHGVPSASQYAVRRLARAAVALRRVMPAPIARRLLELRQRAGDVVADCIQLEQRRPDRDPDRDPGGPPAHGHLGAIAITSR
ncbi:MAG: hypothetical protein ABI442_05020 [Gemmatimonadaceae bacterium]